MRIPLVTAGGSATPQQMQAWLDELATWLDKQGDGVFKCDCTPGYEWDTNYWHHEDTCACHMEGHADVVLRSAAAWFGEMGKGEKGS